MKTPKEYLESLDADTFAIVSAYMARDAVGMVHPDGGQKCPTQCTGEGSTPNGYWVQSPYPDCLCTWVAIV